MPHVISIAGPNYAGCSTLARFIKQSLIHNSYTADIILLEDYKSNRERTYPETPTSKKDFRYITPDPEGIMFARLTEDILSFLKKKSFPYPSFSKDNPKKKLRKKNSIQLISKRTKTKYVKDTYVQPCDFLILEGHLSLYDSTIVDLATVNVYLDAELELSRFRLLHKIGNSSLLLTRLAKLCWEGEVAPAIKQYVIPTTVNAVGEKGLLLRGKDSPMINTKEIFRFLERQLK